MHIRSTLAATALTCLAMAAPLPAADDTGGAEPGQVTGGKTLSHPDWFKESFLDIAEDVDEAADADKHVILFLEMNGCPYCYKMVVENFDGSDYSDWLQEHFDVIALNVRGDREVAIDAETSLSEKQLAEQLDVRYTPTVLFLNQDNETVARINGYRNPEDFKRVLDYVAGQVYTDKTLAAYLDEIEQAMEGYAFREHPQIKEAAEIGDLSKIDGPLALLFEDRACVACNTLHDGHLAAPDVNEVLKSFSVVRVDAQSDEAITGPDGTETTGKQLANELGITYRPTLVLLDGPAGDKAEIARIESMLYRYHFVGLLEYVGQRHYKEYPDSPFDYINAKTARLTAAGKDVSISDE